MFEAIFKVFIFVLIGYIIKKINIFPKKIINWFDFTSFNILLPLALVAYFWQIKFPDINAFHLLLSFFAQ